MARIRTIKPEFPQSESMGNVSREARLLFILLWSLCDDHGKARGSSRLLASLLFPYDKDVPDLIDGWFDELTRERCVIRYEVDGAQFIKVVKWLEHQKIDRPSASKFPDPHEGSILVARPREPSSGDQGSRIKEGTKDQGPGREGNGGADLREAANGAEAPDLPLDEPVFLARTAEGEAVNLWNETAERTGWPKVQMITAARRRALKARLAECGGIEGWQSALAKAEASAFLTGRTKRSADHENWRFSLDFMAKQGPFTKIMEGGFDDCPNRSKSNLSANLEALAEWGRESTGG